jgi:hypothetical protein
MPPTRDVATSMALTRVFAGREEVFETFVREVIVPAIDRARPHTSGLWQLLRPTGDQDGDGSVYAFVFYGEVPESDWDLDTLFAEVHGEQMGRRLSQQFEDMVVGDQEVYAFAGEVAATVTRLR